MTAPRPSVLCAGRLYCDLVFTGLAHPPRLGAETFADHLSIHAGGGAFITAASFSALGWEASLLSRIPAPPFDHVVRAEILQAGVDDRLCVATPAEDGAQITVAMTTQGDRAFLSHKAGVAIPSDARLDPASRHLHIGELQSLKEHPELIKKARAADMTISVDCGWDDDLMTRGAELATLVNEVDVFLPNDVEYKALRASGLPEQIAPLTIVKCGGQGARARQPGVAHWVTQSTKPVDVVDATGAGDAFNGGFLSRWLAGASLETALHEGNRCGAASVQGRGGLGGLASLKAQP